MSLITRAVYRFAICTHNEYTYCKENPGCMILFFVFLKACDMRWYVGIDRLCVRFFLVGNYVKILSHLVKIVSLSKRKKNGPAKSYKEKLFNVDGFRRNSSDPFRDEIIAPKDLRYTAICLISSRFYIKIDLRSESSCLLRIACQLERGFQKFQIICEQFIKLIQDEKDFPFGKYFNRLSPWVFPLDKIRLKL